MPGTHAHLGVFRRDGGPRKLIVTVGELKEEVVAKPAPKRDDVEKHSRYGLALSEMSASLKKNLEIDNGVSVIGVEDGQARNAGLRPGDVIVEVDGKRVSDIATFHRLLEHASPNRPAVLRVRRGMTTLFWRLLLWNPPENAHVVVTLMSALSINIYANPEIRYASPRGAFGNRPWP